MRRALDFYPTDTWADVALRERVPRIWESGFAEPCVGTGRLVSSGAHRITWTNDIDEELPRISFTGDGKTDSVTCAWMIWSKHVQPGIEVIAPSERGGGHQREQLRLAR